MPNANTNAPHSTITSGITAMAFRETIERLHADGDLTAKQRAAVLLRVAPNPVAWHHLARILTHIPPKTGPCSVRTARTHYDRAITKILEAMNG